VYTYLLINILSALVPFVVSFDKRLRFDREWKYFFPAMFLSLIFFIGWDIWFTELGIWGFNPQYLTGIKLVNLPIEEWMFFIFIPYACVFTYHSLKVLVKRDLLGAAAPIISYIIIGILLATILIFPGRWYTGLTFTLTAAFLILILWLGASWLGRFYLHFFIILIPFALVNGLLTGSFIPDEVVWYNNSENLGLRLLTIPVEDSVYALLLLLMNISLYEYFKKHQRAWFFIKKNRG